MDVYPLVMTNIAIENVLFIVDLYYSIAINNWVTLW